MNPSQIEWKNRPTFPPNTCRDLAILQPQISAGPGRHGALHHSHVR
jgi:hypothetical protein